MREYEHLTADEGLNGPVSGVYIVRYFSKKMSSFIDHRPKQRMNALRYLLWDRALTQYRGRSHDIWARWREHIEAAQKGERGNGGITWAVTETLPLAFSVISLQQDLEPWLIHTMGNPTANVEHVRKPVPTCGYCDSGYGLTNETRHITPATSYIYDTYHHYTKGEHRFERVDINLNKIRTDHRFGVNHRPR